VVIGASIGIALSPGDGDESEKLLKNADLALSRAKNDFRGTSPSSRRRWTPAPRAGARSRPTCATPSTRLLQPYYQPLVDLSTGRITGFEALVRWPDPERGMISPAEFIPVAEETGLINPLGCLMLRRACMTPRSGPTTSASPSICRRCSSAPAICCAW
jgi:predicted signal transduction protein with EAL and GGDEF domain